MTLGGADTGQLERLARRGTASVLGAVSSAVCGVGFVVLVTNGFSASLAGTLFAATSAFLVAESVVLLGCDTGLVRWLPAYLASGRAGDVGRALAVALAPVLFSATAGAVSLYLLAPRLALAMVGVEQAPPLVTMLRVLACTLPVAAAYDVLLAATRGLRTMRPTVLVDSVGRLCLQVLAALTVSLLGGGGFALVLAWSLPYLLGLVCVTGWLVRILGARIPKTSRSTAPWGLVAGEFWRFTAPRALTQVTQTALKRLDIVLVAALASPADAAVYTAATRFVVLGQLFVQAVQQALAPHLSALFARRDADAARSVFQAATAWSMLPAWPVYLTAAAFAPQLMRIFGDGYGAGADVVLVLSLAMLFATACGPVDQVLLMAGRSWSSLGNNTAALLVNLILNVVLLPRYGVVGAAFAWAVAIVLRNALPLVQVRRSLAMSPVTGAAMYVAAGSLLSFGAAGALARSWDPSPVTGWLLLALASGGYLSLVGLLRGPLRLDAFRAVLCRREPDRRPNIAAVG